ncbi:hypothetical protein D9756_005448 [Leucocoprinus leucothites]|uniref:Uncharacterized protein n=1 Tax=Leucocoprinus leucothites TaxID=201217 RepID=A0A8H5D7C3_9AGAR|nr:hypothetical protein D9756_005448 [Leucoagaricus leucothites]
MAHPFNSLTSPSLPPPPHPTPSSKSPFKPKLPRPPIYNPFDKFNQNDFDVWIGKLTGDLEKALGYDEELPAPQDDAAPVGSVVAEPTEIFEDYLEDNSVVEDSFAEVKARRVNKGKARDPREGPGLGPKAGDQDQPIEILSDEEDEGDNSQVLGSDGSEEGGEYEEEYDEEGEEEQEEEEEEAEAGTSARTKEYQSHKGEEYYEEYDEEDGEGDAASREGSAENAIELSSDAESAPRVVSKHRQQEDEDQFLSDEGEDDDVRSSPAQFDEDAELYDVDEQENEDEIQPSDEDTSFPPHSHHNKGQPSTTADTLVDIRDPWERVEKYAEDYYAGGELTIPPRIYKKGLLAAHYLGVKDDDSATGFLSPDVVSNVDLDNEEDEEEKEREMGVDRGGKDQDEDEEGEEEEGNYNDLIDEDESEQAAEEEVNEEDHLFNRLQPSFARRPFGMSYVQGPQFPSFNIKSGPGSNEEPITIDSDDDEEALPPVAQRQSERDHHVVQKENAREKEDGEKVQDGEELVEEEEDFLDELVDEVYTENQREGGNEEEPEETLEADNVDENEVEEIPRLRDSKLVGEGKPSEDAAVPDVGGKADAIEEAKERIQTDEGVRPALSTVAMSQAAEMAQEPTAFTHPFFPNPFQSEPAAAVATADELLLPNRDVPAPVTDLTDQSLLGQQPASGNIVNWTTLDVASFPLAQPQSSDLIDHLNVPLGSMPIPGLTGDVMNTMTANVDAQVFGFTDMASASFGFGPSPDDQQTGLHGAQPVVQVDDTEGSIVGSTEQGKEEADALDIGAKVDELEEDESMAFVPLMTSDLDYLEYGETVEEEEDELRDLTPTLTEAAAVETRLQHAEATDAAEDGGEGSEHESGVQIFVEEPEEDWEGTPPAEITIKIQAATPIPPSPIMPMENNFEETPAPLHLELDTVDNVAEEDLGMEAGAVTAATPSPTPREGTTAEDAIAVDDEGEDEDYRRDPPTIVVEELVTETASPEEHVLEEAADITFTALGMETAYDIEEPLTASEYHTSEGPSSSRAVSLGIASVRSDEVMPSAEFATGDVEEVVSDVEPEQDGRAEGVNNNNPKYFSAPFDDTGELETQSISVETQFEVTELGMETPVVVTDVRNSQSTAPPLPGLNHEMLMQAEEIPANNETVDADADDVHAFTHTQAHTHTDTFPATTDDDDADGYFAQPGSPVMDHHGLMDFTSSPSGGLPTIIQLPGTPQRVLSPRGTPLPGPTPVAIAVDPAVLKALKTNPGLFTPPTSVPTSQESAQGSEQSAATAVNTTNRHTASVIATTPESTGEVATECYSPVTRQPSPDIFPIAEEGPANEVEVEESPAPNGAPSFQTAFPATTVQGKPTLPTLYDDPYPYSLSTPGPQNEVEGSEEESTEQENSISTTTSSTSASSSSGAAAATAKKSEAAAEEEVILNKVADNVEVHSPPSEITIPTEPVVVPPASEGIDEVFEVVEKGLVDVEAEANKLIDEFLVDEPDTDTDADGEADPEFVLEEDEEDEIASASAGEEVVIQEVDQDEVEPRGEGAVAASAEPVVEEVEQPVEEEERKEEESSPQIVEEQRAEEIAEGMVAASPKTDVLVPEEDPFKLMGNDSLVAPGEVEELEIDRSGLNKEGDEESQDEAEVAAAFAVPEREPEAEPETMPLREAAPKEQQQTHQTPTFPQIHLPPVTVSRPPLSAQILRPPSSVSSSGHVGPVPYHLAAAAYMQGLSSPLPLQWADRPSTTNPRPLDTATAPVRSLQPKASQSVTSPTAEHASAVVSTPVSTVTSSDDKLRETASSGGLKPQVEVPPRKVQISVEDPYHADNDSDHEQGHGSHKAQKRKRSQSDVSSPEHPITPVKSALTISTDKGKGKSKSPPIRRKLQARRGMELWRRAQLTASRRSPSVTSTVTSESSLVTQPSPSYVSSASSELRPFLHAHSRRKRGKAPTTMQEQLQKQRLSSLPSASGSRTGILRAEDVLIKAPSVSSTNTSSPVTRSHCRYHKISIPKTENGPRINFLVPGCSLNDEDLINEEEIEDHGEAILPSDTYVVDDIETLDFEAYLHWVMRQLVGPEILRENEVFYLPQPGEEVVRNPHRPEKRKGGRPEKKRSKQAEETTAELTQNMNTGQLPSRGSSAASSTSVLQQILETGDLSDVTETEDEKSSPTKSGGNAGEIGSSEMNRPLTQRDNGSTFSRKRARRLGQDATAYQPTTDSDHQSSTDFSDYNPTRKGPNRSRGQKRSRSEANPADGADSRKAKKSKTRSSQPQVQTNGQQPSTTDNLNRHLIHTGTTHSWPAASWAPSNVP